MAKTGQAAAVSPTSATLLINRVSAMVLKVAVATALPKTSCAHVVTAAGVTTISHEIRRRSRLSRGRSITRCGPSVTGR
jgi:hypothetical protein